MPMNFNFSIETDCAEDFKRQMNQALSMFDLQPTNNANYPVVQIPKDSQPPVVGHSEALTPDSPVTPDTIGYVVAYVEPPKKRGRPPVAKSSEPVVKRKAGRPPKVREPEKPMGAAKPSEVPNSSSDTKPADVTQVVPSSYDASDVVKIPVTLDTCKLLLKRVADKYGCETEDDRGYLLGTELLRRFDCEKVSELPPQHYSEFISKCEVALNGGAI